MKRKALGCTGLQVSEIAFGGVEIGVPYGIGVQGREDMLSERAAINLLHEALEKGINFFDTARLYGESETIMGKAFASQRQDIVLATKCRHFRDSSGALPPDSALKIFIQKSLKESLRELQTDYIDVYMLHYGDLEVIGNEVIAEVFQDLKKQGIIRATGVSTYLAEETALAISKGHWDVIQLPFNLMDQRHAACFDDAAARDVGIVVRSVLMKGLLSDRGKNLHPALKDVERHIGNYHSLLGGEYPDLPTLATRFALSFESIASVLVGIDRPEYLYQALATAGGADMQPDALKTASQMAYPEPEFLNLPHWDRMGWLQ
ncbi:Predicted oxidoreductase [Dyadobacter sp. SG02]|uniref:aldo/keto reductase n=1 Tax=Dyadobacter sp. SG02 TaxID=1855291 RepID=UPI0008B6308F|nr:aldo/keto reductase [Dyadobacter sp. SG02]SEJ58595.1 Predicted oxidoreductase [Dyadobacter sp. SG02]